MDDRRLASPRSGHGWTRVDDYIAALARRRTARRARQERPRTQPETPRFSLSTLPFVALIGALLLLSIAIFVIAWPGNQPQPERKQVAQNERGYAAKGWFQEAEKQFH